MAVKLDYLQHIKVELLPQLIHVLIEALLPIDGHQRSHRSSCFDRPRQIVPFVVLSLPGDTESNVFKWKSQYLLKSHFTHFGLSRAAPNTAAPQHIGSPIFKASIHLTVTSPSIFVGMFRAACTKSCDSRYRVITYARSGSSRNRTGIRESGVTFCERERDRVYTKQLSTDFLYSHCHRGTSNRHIQMCPGAST